MNSHALLRWRSFVGAAALLLLAAVTLIALARDSAQAGHVANHEPADKHQVAAANDVRVSPGAEQTVLTERIRSSSPADLELMFTSECGIFFAQIDGSRDADSAFAEARARVYVDGRPVPVVAGPGDTPPRDDGSVALCQRRYGDSQSQPGVFEEQEEDVTQSANGFNWVKLDVGNGLHIVEVRVQLREFIFPGEVAATAFIGRRTLTIEPTHMDVGQDKTPAGE